MLIRLLGLFIGGGLGTLCRYALSSWLNPALGHGMPWGTLLVNVLGGLLIGILIGGLSRLSMTIPLQLFLISGFLGGFTTFSAFCLESVTLLKTDQAPLALLYILLSVGLGLLGVYTGLEISRMAQH